MEMSSNVGLYLLLAGLLGIAEAPAIKEELKKNKEVHQKTRECLKKAA